MNIYTQAVSEQKREAQSNVVQMVLKEGLGKREIGVMAEPAFVRSSED